MFTGIVSAVGRIDRVVRTTENGKRTTPGLTLRIRAPFKGLKTGESIAVNGACLTVERAVKGGFSVHVVETTEGRTLFGEYAPGRPVNLERALRAADRLGGHIVQGHVDAVGRLEAITPNGDWLAYRFQAPRAVWPYLVEKGAIAVDGVSLTVFACRQGSFTVALIPHTLAATTLADLKPGERVNLETDMLLKQIRSMLRSRHPVVG